MQLNKPLIIEEKSKQIKNSMLYLTPIAVSSLLPLITLPVFTRILTKEDYGVLALAQVYATFVSGLSNFGLIIGYERNYFQYRDPKSAAQLLYSTLAFVVSAFSLCAVLTYFFRADFSKWIIKSPDYGNLLFWAFCAASIVNIKNYYLTYFKNAENAKAFVWYTIYESVLGVILSLFCVVYLRVGVIGLVWGQLAASLTILLILGGTFLKLHTPAFNSDILKESLKISIPLTPKIFFGIIGNQFDKYMIGLLNTVGGVGIYSIGQRIAYMVFSYMTALQNVYSPQVYKRMFALSEKGGESIGRYMTPFIYLSLACAVLVALFSEEIIIILLPQSYHGAVEIVVILSMFYGSLLFGKQPQLTYTKKTYITSLITIQGIILNVLFNIPLIMKWGAIGAAWGTFAAGLINSLISFHISQKYYEIKWEYGKIASIFLIFFGSAITMILLRNFGIHYGVRIIVKLAALTGYLYLGMKMGVLTRENYLLVKNMIVPAKKNPGFIG